MGIDPRKIIGGEMTNYRRNRLPGGTYFFTLTLNDRKLDLLVRYIEQLKAAYRAEKQRAPFVNLGLVVLPDHMHALWQLPEGEIDYSNRWRRIKRDFSRALTRLSQAGSARVSASRAEKGELGIWQRRFWEYTIRDEEDLRRHLDYVHRNPVKHGLVKRAGEWPHSTFSAYVAKGYYAADWVGGEVEDDIGE